MLIIVAVNWEPFVKESMFVQIVSLYPFPNRACVNVCIVLNVDKMPNGHKD